MYNVYSTNQIQHSRVYSCDIAGNLKRTQLTLYMSDTLWLTWGRRRWWGPPVARSLSWAGRTSPRSTWIPCLRCCHTGSRPHSQESFQNEWKCYKEKNFIPQTKYFEMWTITSGPSSRRILFWSFQLREVWKCLESTMNVYLVNSLLCRISMFLINEFLLYILWKVRRFQRKS